MAAIIRPGNIRSNREKIAELATIGATRNLDVERGTWKWTKLELPPKYQLTRRAIEIIDLAGRLVMDDMYQFGVRRLGFKNNETQRREFINQIGRYNHRVQGLTMAAIVRSGLGPFAVAGTTFNLLGVRNVTGRPGVSAKSKAAAVGLWIATLAPLISTFVIARMVNQAITGDPNGRHGVPVGAVDTGLDNKDGRPIYVDLFKYGGARRGARILGLNAAMNKWANPDIPAGQAVAQAFKESGNTLMHPALGPAVQAMSIFTQRRPIGIETPEVVAAPRPDESGMYERVMGALTHGLNPIASAVGKAEETQTSAMESIRDTLGRTAGVGTASTTTQAAIHGARLRDYAEDVARRAKRIPIEGGQRIRFIAESVSGLPPKDAARVRMIVLRERGAMLSR